jgi:hypothetical protein
LRWAPFVDSSELGNGCDEASLLTCLGVRTPRKSAKKQEMAKQLSSSHYNPVASPIARNANPRDTGSRPSVAELVALQAVGWPFTTLMLTTLLFVAGIPIGPYHLWAALVLFLVVGGTVSGDWRAWLIAALWLALCVVAGGASLGWLYDFSGDGQW